MKRRKISGGPKPPKTGAFETQINECGRILRLAKLFSYRMRGHYPSGLGKTLRALPYAQQWDKCRKEGWYDFRMTDHSLLQMHPLSDEAGKATYGLYECPYAVVGYDEWLRHDGLDPKSEGDLWREEYDAYVVTCACKEYVTPVRYDYSELQYTPGRHPVSHLHFGFANEIRVSADKVWKPVTFVLFVIRQYYPDRWTLLCQKQKETNIFKNVRASLHKTAVRFRNALDEREVILT